MPKKKKLDLDLSEGSAPKTTDIYHVFILDKSGSMGCVQKQTLDGLNINIDGIKEDYEKDNSIKHHFTLVTFSDPDEIKTLFWNKPASEISRLTNEDYVPVGGTALLDAIGTTLSKIKTDNEISNGLKEKTAQVLLTVMTDGDENTSKEFKHEQIEKAIKELQDDKENGWTVTYVGASPKTHQTAQTMGFAASNTMQYDSSQVGTSSAFNVLKSCNSAYSAAAGMGMKSMKMGYFADDIIDQVDQSSSNQVQNSNTTSVLPTTPVIQKDKNENKNPKPKKKNK